MPQSTSVANQYYEAERILDEKMSDDGTLYLIKWKGMDQNGKPWEPTWEPARNCTQPLISSWGQRNKALKRKIKSPSAPSSPSASPSKNSPNKREKKYHKTAGGFSYGTPSGESAESPMLIDSDDDISRFLSQNNGLSSKLNQVDGASNVGATVVVKDFAVQRHLLRPYHILLPVPLSKLQQMAYLRTIDKPQFFKYLAETNLATPPELDSIIFQAKDQLLKIVNHLSLLLSSIPGHSQGANASYQSFEKTGKLVMMYYLLNGLRNCDLTLGIAIPQGPIMNSIIKDFMKKHKFNFNVLNETANKKLLKETEISTSDDKLLCIVFTTPLPKMSEEELPQFDLVIAYDTSFNPKKHLLHTKTNENIPTIRLVTKNTLEHALNYQMSQQEDNFLFSDLSLFEMKRILSFGLWKRNQSVEAGCELEKFDIRGTCDKVFQWINDGMLRNLTFGMEAAVEKVWGKTIPPEHVTFDRSRLVGMGNAKERKDLGSIKAEKRVPDINDEGSPKKRKDKEVSQNEDDDFQKNKKLKVIEETSAEVSNTSSSSKNGNKALSLSTSTSTTQTILSPTEPLTESPIEQNNLMSLNKSKQVQSQKSSSKDDSPRDSRRSSLKDSSRDSYNKSRDSTQDTVRDSSSSSKHSIKENNNKSHSKDSNKNVKGTSKDSNKNNKDVNKEQSTEEHVLEWKQKYMELLTQSKLQDEKIENLTQEKDKYCQKTNELSSELARTRTQLGTKRTLLETQINELDKIRKEMAEVQLENGRIKSDAENKEQEIQKLKKEIESLKTNSKTMKTKIKSLEIEIQVLNDEQARIGQSTSKKNESLEDQVKKLEGKITTLQLQCKLQKQELKLALEDDGYQRDITELLLKLKGKTRKEMDEIYLAKKKDNQSKPTLSDNNVNTELSNELSFEEKTLNEINSEAILNVPVIDNIDNTDEILLAHTINTASNGDGILSSSSFGYYDSELNELPEFPYGSYIHTTSAFTCNWDNCRKEFEKREDLKSHLKSSHSLDPNSISNNIIEISD